MLRHNLLLAIRQLKKQRGYSFLNIFGFSVSISCFLLVVIYVNHELSYDEYHEHSERIYRVSEQLSDDVVWVPINGDQIEAIAPDIPEIETFVRFDPGWANSHHLSYQDKEFFEDLKSFYWTDSSVFDVFDIELLLGKKDLALKGPGSIIISEKASLKYFGSENPIGKVIKRAKTESYLVKGVFKKIPGNSHLKFDFLATKSGMKQSWAYTYIRTNTDVTSTTLDKKLNASREKHFKNYGFSGNRKLIVLPLNNIHLDSHFEYETEIGGNKTNVLVLAITGLLILCVGFVNFINMYTAKATLRGKEVGVRKAIGSSRRQLISQFYTEAFLSTTISTLLALGLVIFIWPFYQDLVGEELVVPELLTIAPKVLLFAVFTTLAAGSYPAFLLSSFHTVQVLKGGARNGRGSARLRKVLVTIQFIASIFLISGILVVSLQLRYFNQKSLGFEKDQLLAVVGDIGLNDVSVSEAKTLRDRWLSHPNINEVAKSRGVPTKLDWIGLVKIEPEGIAHESEIRSIFNRVDHSYVKAMKLEVIAGRDFSVELDQGQQDKVLINETAAKLIGWENPIGKKIDLTLNTKISATVVGVVKDHHTQSLHVPVSPQLFKLYTGTYFFYWTVQMGDANPLETLTFMEDIWKSSMTRPFDHFFVDEEFDQQYQTDRRFATAFGSFTVIAIFVCGLGLLGLTTFTIQLRMKEIGVRKVLGASISGIIFLLSKSIFSLIFIAFTVACPIAFFMMRKWLNGFAYRIEIPIWVFGVTLIIAIFLAMISTLSHSFKAALTNPTKILKSE